MVINHPPGVDHLDQDPKSTSAAVFIAVAYTQYFTTARLISSHICKTGEFEKTAIDIQYI